MSFGHLRFRMTSDGLRIADPPAGLRRLSTEARLCKQIRSSARRLGMGARALRIASLSHKMGRVGQPKMPGAVESLQSKDRLRDDI